MRRNERIVDVYNEFAEKPTIESALKAMVYTTLLEGLFFYSGFAFFYNLARNQKMVGTSTMVSYINRDELQHGKAISDIFRAAFAENPSITQTNLQNGSMTNSATPSSKKSSGAAMYLQISMVWS